MSRVSLSRIPHTRRESKALVIGPIKIFCSTNDDNIPCEIILGILNSLAQVCIGATNAIVVFSAVQHPKDLHALLTCVGYNFFMVEAILSLNFTNGWSIPIGLPKKRFLHMFLQFCAIGSITTGTLIPIFSKFDLKNPHAILGLMALVCALCTFLLGPLALFGSQRLKILHITFGLPTVVLAFLCMLHGLLQGTFEKWASKYIPYIVIGISFYFTMYIVVMTFLKCVLRIKYSPGDI